MLKPFVVAVFGVYLLSACAQQKSNLATPKQEGEINSKPLSANCLHAKQELDKAVQAGEHNSLHELKRNIELYCVWRRY